MKILIVKPSSLGDVVHSLPLLRLIKRHLPQSEIYWWLGADLVPLLERDPDLAGIIEFERRHWHVPRNWPALWQSIRRLRSHHFDWVIDLQGLARSGTFAWLANGKFLVGLDNPREGAHGFYDLAVPRPSAATHAVDWYLSLLPHLGVPVHHDFIWLPPQPEVAARVRQKWPVEGHRWLILNPGARWLNKRWSAENFMDLVSRLAADHAHLRFAVLGGSSERELGRTITQAVPARCLDLTGQTSLPELVEWIRLGELMVTNDTGPMHIAAALKKPVVALFGPTRSQHTGPYGQIQRVLQLSLPCVPCMKSTCKWSPPLECLRGLAATQVQAEVDRRWLSEGK